MPMIEVDGLRVAYELHGEGDPVIITPGGRYGKDTKGIREFALALADAGKQALIWDRPNTGESEITFDRGFEPVMQADALAGLIRELGLGPTTVVGGSNGTRVSMLAAGRHPDVVHKLAVLWVSSGLYMTAMRLSLHYCGDAWDAARTLGMQGVVDLAADGPVDWPTRPKDTANREKVLAMDPQEFMAIMEDWAQKFLTFPGSPVAGMEVEDFTRIEAPTLVFNSSPLDLNHPRATTEGVHALIAGSQLVELPFGQDEWNERMTEFMATGQHVHFVNWYKLVPQLLEFIDAPVAHV